VESLLRRGDPEIRSELRRALVDSSAARRSFAARWLALAGDGRDTAALVDAVNAGPEPVLLRALGRHGSPRALDALVECLDAGEENAAAASEALYRITAAPLLETVEVPWAPGAEPGAPLRPVQQPSRDRALWSQWCGRNAARLDARARWRHGRPFELGMIVEELASAATPPAQRDDAATELAIAGGMGLRLRTDDWVARQNEQLADLDERVRSRAITSGAWCYAGAVSRSG
jgi:hypothetical protein